MQKYLNIFTNALPWEQPPAVAMALAKLPLETAKSVFSELPPPLAGVVLALIDDMSPSHPQAEAVVEQWLSRVFGFDIQVRAERSTILRALLQTLDTGPRLRPAMEIIWQHRPANYDRLLNFAQHACAEPVVSAMRRIRDEFIAEANDAKKGIDEPQTPEKDSADREADGGTDGGTDGENNQESDGPEVKPPGDTPTERASATLSTDETGAKAETEPDPDTKPDPDAGSKNVDTGPKKQAESDDFSREELVLWRAWAFVDHDIMVLNTANAMSNYLEAPILCRLKAITPMTTARFVKETPVPSLTQILRAEERPLTTVLVADVNLVVSVVNLLLGNRQGPVYRRKERPLTEIDARLMQQVLRPMVEEFNNAIQQSSGGLTFSLENVVSKPAVDIFAPSDDWLAVYRFVIETPRIIGRIDLPIPERGLYRR